MQKQTIGYTSPLDTLVAVAKRLSLYEKGQQLSSEDFFDQYSWGHLGDEALYVEWANDYRHYLALRQDLEELLVQRQD
ncbi:antitoxin TumA [Nodosilinea sp. P-1105]|uniref:antitoxin TumA n=1 Tax=Nodosilinea sp. P-1105 TaxID=2546229 RepID=UPI00146D2836|nr:hypothetical protein [Nodosilinea sp. P-1105]NMF82751.1 hypothetical protein [Nodosilinea sp. P-1105]